MKKTLLSLATLTALSVSCGTEQDPVDVTTDTAIKNGMSNKVAAIVSQTNIVASDKNTTAEVHDPTLINAWGLVFSPKGPAWISVNGGGIANIYNKDGSLARPAVTVPPASPASKPTGQVLNTDPNALFGEQFIFATEDGTVSGWKAAYGNIGMIHFTLDGAVFKGLALARVRGKLRVYLADFHDNKVVVLDDEYHPIHHRPGAFVDRRLPDGYAPFNIFAADGLLFVSYAKQKQPDLVDDDSGPGRGFVDVFEPDGDLVERLISRGPLNSPWGMAIMPPAKGHDEERLLVGNFGDGRINVFELEHHDGKPFRAEFEGALGDKAHHPIAIEGLWAIVFGSGVGNFDTDDIYFTAGPNDEGDGIFGELSFE